MSRSRFCLRSSTRHCPDRVVARPRMRTKRRPVLGRSGSIEGTSRRGRTAALHRAAVISWGDDHLGAPTVASHGPGPDPPRLDRLAQGPVAARPAGGLELLLRQLAVGVDVDGDSRFQRQGPYGDHRTAGQTSAGAAPTRQRQKGGNRSWAKRRGRRLVPNPRQSSVSVEPSRGKPLQIERRRPESNRCTRLCRPLRSHSATAPAEI
jgi:hypothetical protein